MKISKNSIIVFLLLVVLVLVNYMVLDNIEQKTKQIIEIKTNEARQEGHSAGYQEALPVGYDNAVTDLFTRAVACDIIPVGMGNQTIQVVAVECLNQK